MTSARVWLGLLSVIAVLFVLPSQCESNEMKVLVIMIDHGPTGFIYSVDGKSTSADFLTYLDNHTSEWPPQKTRVVLLVHDQVSLAMVNNSRGMIIKAGYEPPRVFHFNRDKRAMVEITFMPAVPFSAKGPG